MGQASTATDSDKGLTRPHRIFVGLAYVNLGLMLIILFCVSYWRWGPPLISPLPSQGLDILISQESHRCIDCHQKEGVQPLQIDEWRRSRHAGVGIGCYECHQALPEDKDGHKHHERFVSTIVSPKDCSRCHDKEVKEFQGSRHAHGGEILASLDNYLGEVVEGLPAAITGCRWCHGAKIDVQKDGHLSPTSWPNTGIGRINPDGSLGSCSACHPRHRFSSAVARRPENCGRCHLGPDHPQFEIYQASKHGIAFTEAQGRMNLDARDWRLGTSYTAAPTCSTCHNAANVSLESNHDVGLRIAWTLRPEVSVRLEDWQERRLRMKSTCRHCHSPGWTDSFFTQFDTVVDLYNEKFAKPAQGIMDTLYDEGKISPTPFDDEIEWTYFLLWHHEGRRARHGASMMGPDYTQWHGFFEVAERFYMEFLPQAEALLSGSTDSVLDADDHQWLEGAPDELRKRIESFYRERYQSP